MSKPPSVFRSPIRNWGTYNRALIKRGRLTVWCDEDAVAAWRHTAPVTGRGASRRYADLAIECALVFKSVYHLSLRAAQGLRSSGWCQKSSQFYSLTQNIGVKKLPISIAVA